MRRAQHLEFKGAHSAIIDSDVLIEVIKRGMAEKLSVLFSTIYVPMAVKEEQIKQRRRHNLNRLFKTKIFEKCKAKGEDRVQILLESLGSGESEAIIQAQEKNIRVFLTDDRDASKMAEKFNLLPVTFSMLEQELRSQGFIS